MIQRYSLVAVRFLLVMCLGSQMTQLAHAAETAPAATGWVKMLNGGPPDYNITYTAAVAPASNGGFVVLGMRRGRPWLGKFDVNGQPRWSWVSDGELVRPRTLQAFPNNDLVVVIENWLMKFSAQGGVIWQRALDGFRYGPYALAIRADGMIALVNSDVSIALIDGNSGQLKWAKRFEAYYNETAAPAFTSDGGLLVGTARFDNGHLTKFAADGTILWQKPFIGGISKILPVENNEFIGATAYGTLLRFDGLGNVLWERRYTETQVTIPPAHGDYYHPGFNSLIRLADGSLIAAGITTHAAASASGISPPESDIWIIKTDATGNLLWSRRYGRVGATNYESTGGLSPVDVSSGPPYVSAYDNLVALADGVVVVGNHYDRTTELPGRPSFGLLLKLNAEGLVGGACDWQLPSVVQTDTLQIRYPSAEQAPTIFTPTLPAIQVGLFSSSISMTTTCDGNSTGAVIANAGPDVTARYSTTVTLDGSKSVDSIGADLRYKWTQTAGTVVVLNGV